MEFQLKDEYIKLGQLLKACDMVASGADAKEVVQGGEVLVNGEVDTRRGRKIVAGDVVSYHGRSVTIR